MSHIRAGINAQAIEPQIKAWFRELHARGDSLGVPMYIPSDSTMIVFSNMAKTGMLDIDFRGAAVDQDARRIGTVSPVFTHIETTGGGNRASSTSVFITTSRDGHGNYWMTGRTSPETWDRIESYIGTKKNTSVD